MKKTISLVLVFVSGLATEVANTDFTFGTPTNPGPRFNMEALDGTSCILADCHEVIFETQRPGGSGSSDSGSEDLSPALIEMTLSHTSDRTITVDYSVTGGTAIAVDEYDLFEPNAMTFNPGQTSKNISIDVIDDDEKEDNETINLALSNASNAVLSSPTTHTYTITDNEQQLAFPEAEGAGRYAIGGRGGSIYEVTNLNDSGPGSLREAVQASGPRIVVFRISGTIELQSPLRIFDPFITIAGQSAPGGGICLKNYRLQISADHVIVRYIRCRPGDNEGREGDSLSILAGHNIIIDHCSASWSVDETLSVSTSRQLGNVTVQWCLITESLDCSVHSKGCHGCGSLICGSWGNAYSLHHNLYAHHRNRSPRPGNYNDYTIDPDGLIFDFRNNVIYNWGGSAAGYNADTNSITKMNFVANYYKQGPDSTDDYAFREECTYSRAYFSGNCMNGSNPGDPWNLVDFRGFTEAEKNAYKQTSPIEVAQVDTDDAITAYEQVLADAGVTVPERDTVDARLVENVINGTGGIIDDEDEVGGWPVLAPGTPPVDSDHDGMADVWELSRGLNPGNPADSAEDRNADGYTNIEEYLNWLCSTTAKSDLDNDFDRRKN